MSIGSTIKKLRRERDMTQEQLAEYLGITANAVSQWECDRTMPDISQLPILANLFEVTADYLLEIDVSQKQSAIERIRNEAWEKCNSGDKDGAAETVRCALTNYPNSFILMQDLVIFLYQSAFHQEREKEKRLSLCTEASELIDKILSGCNDIKICGNVTELACSIFPIVGRKDDAVDLINKIPDISKDELLMSLYSGDKLVEHIKDFICKSVGSAADRISFLASMNKDGVPLFDDDIRLMLYKKSVTLYETLYEEGDYFFDAECLASAEKHIADIYALRKDADNTLRYLTESVNNTVMFDTYDGSKDSYTSVIVFGRSPVGVNWNNGWNTSHEMYSELKTDANYDFIRTVPEFQKLIDKLKQTDNMK